MFQALLSRKNAIWLTPETIKSRIRVASLQQKMCICGEITVANVTNEPMSLKKTSGLTVILSHCEQDFELQKAGFSLVFAAF